MEIGKTIRKIRKNKGFTIKKLSDKSGVSEGTIYSWEKELACPTVLMLSYVADVLNVTLDELVGRRK